MKMMITTIESVLMISLAFLQVLERKRGLMRD